MEYEDLVNQHKDAVFREMLRVCGNYADAEDVLIDALLRAWRHLDQLQDSAAFRAWLTQIARRVCWNLRSREAIVPMLQFSELPDQGASFADRQPPAEQVVEAQQLKSALRAALDALSPEYRNVYLLRDVEGLPGVEVARRLDISVPSMKSRLHRARRLLRARLETDLGITESSKLGVENGSHS